MECTIFTPLDELKGAKVFIEPRGIKTTQREVLYSLRNPVSDSRCVWNARCDEVIVDVGFSFKVGNFERRVVECAPYKVFDADLFCCIDEVFTVSFFFTICSPDC